MRSLHALDYLSVRDIPAEFGVAALCCRIGPKCQCHKRTVKKIVSIVTVQATDQLSAVAIALALVADVPRWRKPSPLRGRSRDPLGVN
jgi:hypothetical protein